jgi:hypothetical protein
MVWEISADFADIIGTPMKDTLDMLSHVNNVNL